MKRDADTQEEKKVVPKRTTRMKRSTHAYCPRCHANQSQYGLKACEDCGLVFGMLHVEGNTRIRRPLRFTKKKQRASTI